MNKAFRLLLLLFLITTMALSANADELDDDFAMYEEEPEISDPLEPVNRLLFQ